jgi:putative transposase
VGREQGAGSRGQTPSSRRRSRIRFCWSAAGLRRIVASMTEQHKRLAHPSHVARANKPTVIFLTACSNDRQAHYDSPTACEVLLSAWERALQWRVAEYVIMPDHIHLFCVPGVHAPEPVTRWSRYWKRLAGVSMPELKGSWQRDVWDRQIRSLADLDEKRSYVRMNPVRAGLCRSPDDWPYKGVLREILW